MSGPADVRADLPIVDLRQWIDGSDRSAVASSLDRALSDVGFFLLVGHDVDPTVVHRARDVYRRFFALPAEEKGAVRMPRLGLSGWAPLGMEANGYSFGHETPPDLKESFRTGAHELPGRLPLRGANVWPAHPADFRSAVVDYLAAVDRVHLTLLEVCAVALGLDPDHFLRHALRNDNTLNVNWYAPPSVFGGAVHGQFRIGPHTDFGTLTVLHREPGSHDLQVQLPSGEWVAAPVLDGSFTINCGDMLSLWSGGRWRSAIHRVPAPAHDDLGPMSIVYFCEPDPETMISPVSGSGPTVNAGDYLRSKIDAITVSADALGGDAAVDANPADAPQ